MTHHAHNQVRGYAFTLIELLVVISIIAVLLAILMPAIGRARAFAQRIKCMTNQRNINIALMGYVADNNRTYPTYHNRDDWRAPRYGPGIADAYGFREDYPYSGPADREALGLGLTVEQGHLPVGSLGDVIHCPSLDNLDSPAKGHCMNVKNPSGYGGDWWEEKPQYRIIGSYNYRGTSYELKYNHGIRLSDASATFVLLIDTPDLRFRGPKSAYNAHGGYNHVFGDGSGRFLEDPEYIIDSYAYMSGANGVMDGRRNNDEPMYEYLSEATN